MHGKLIVIEGTDGSGKTTQLELLQNYFKTHKKRYHSLSFPQYSKTFFGRTIGSFLRGEIAPLERIDPYLISLVYAMDRAEVKEKLYKWLNKGEHILLNRYVTSNMAHQAGRLPNDKVSHFLRWINELEYTVNNIPREDIVLYLRVPYQTTVKLMENIERKDRVHMKGRSHDIVEKDKKYLKDAEAAYVRLSKKFSHWVTIECINESGTMKSKEAISQEIITVLRQKHMIDF